MGLGIVLTPPEKLQKLSTKLFTINGFAALVAIVIANAMGWVSMEEDVGEIVGAPGDLMFKNDSKARIHCLSSY